MFYVERTEGSRKEVYFHNRDFFVQTYIIEEDTVKSYRWGATVSPLDNNIEKEDAINLWWYWFHRTLNPNANLHFSENYFNKKGLLSRYFILSDEPQNPSDVSSDTITTSAICVDCSWNYLGPPPPPSPALSVLKWSGSVCREPLIITDFCADVTEDANKPEYMRNHPLSWKTWTFKWPKNHKRETSKIFQFGHRIYPSYLRAIPLHTEEEQEQAKSTPLVEMNLDSFFYKGNDYHVAFAVSSPYTLIPVLAKGSPLPFLDKPYEPGRDKVRVRRDLGDDGYVYFLVETFKGEGWVD